MYSKFKLISKMNFASCSYISVKYITKDLNGENGLMLNLALENYVNTSIILLQDDDNVIGTNYIRKQYNDIKMLLKIKILFQ